MLGKPTQTSPLKNVCLHLANEPFNQLIKALLLEWGYRLTDDPTESPLLLMSDTLERPPGFNHCLVFSSSHYQDRHRLEVPLTIENLYLALENHFHRTPRNHIRINLEWPIRVRVRNQQFDSVTVTIADRGIRFVSPFELMHEEEIEIHIERDSEVYDLHARAVYSIGGKEIGRGDHFEVGAVCVPQSKEVRESIRSRIIGTYLRRVRPVLGSALFTEALRQLNLTRMSQEIAIS